MYSLVCVIHRGCTQFTALFTACIAKQRMSFDATLDSNHVVSDNSTTRQIILAILFSTPVSSIMLLWRLLIKPFHNNPSTIPSLLSTKRYPIHTTINSVDHHTFQAETMLIYTCDTGCAGHRIKYFKMRKLFYAEQFS